MQCNCNVKCLSLGLCCPSIICHCRLIARTWQQLPNQFPSPQIRTWQNWMLSRMFLQYDIDAVCSQSASGNLASASYFGHQRHSDFCYDGGQRHSLPARQLSSIHHQFISAAPVLKSSSIFLSLPAKVLSSVSHAETERRRSMQAYSIRTTWPADRCMDYANAWKSRHTSVSVLSQSG